MRILPVLLLRLSLLVALTASAALVVEYRNAGDPAFCGVQSGCFAVRVSPYSDFFGAIGLPDLAQTFGPLPLPSVGLAVYAILLGLTLLARNRVHHVVIAGMAALGGLFAVRLLLLQKYQIQAFCPWCVAVDSASIVAAIAAVWVAAKAWFKGDASVALPQSGRVMGAWSAAALSAVLAPVVWGHYPVQPELSPAVQAVHAPGKVTIVTFTDFECPFCRKLHPALHDVVERHQGKVQLVRRMNPLGGHRGAEPAALAYLCTPEALREAVADKLYTAESEQLTSEGTVALAASAGADKDALAQCVKAPETRAKLEADRKLFEELGGRGLPFTFVGRRVVLGFRPDKLNEAVASELAGSGLSLPLWAMFALLGAIFLGAAAVTLNTVRQEKDAAEQSPPAG
ncbi:vitamin K epoxide reductase family protein [Polyangium aurulentum]|uniref:vitamin K epoxide reductase family protein n=1 Tax=Polyangium aurulentum TaxID=2567896 RepID=UPI00146B13B2|nr:vitamin K epoxide reductase family protein [Polyangium aurulentum]UQA60215.1 thioredoxin domain-containing protein [Polyangium aurulentum]